MKRGFQSTWSPGYRLSRIEGPVASNYFELSSHSGDSVTPLGSDLGRGKGWAPNTNYPFELEYTDTRLRISIAGEVIFDVEGDFKPGHFGFYNNSQATVDYFNFTCQR